MILIILNNNFQLRIFHKGTYSPQLDGDPETHAEDFTPTASKAYIKLSATTDGSGDPIGVPEVKIYNHNSIRNTNFCEEGGDIENN